MADRRSASLGDLVDITVGFPFRSAKFSQDASDIRLLRGDNVGQGVLRWANAAYWPRTENVPSEYALIEGDVVIAMDRPWIGAGLKYAVVRAHDEPSYLVQRVARLRARPGVDQGYIAYLIASQEFTDHVLSVQTGTSIPHISANQIAAFNVDVHAPADQRAIAEVLGALDDKIAANTRIVQSAEALASAMFESMMQETELLPLSSVARFVNGKAFTKGASGTGRVVVRIAELNSGIGGSTVFSDAVVAPDHVANPGDILFAWSGSLTLHRWFRPEAIINQHIFKVLPNVGRPHWLVWALVAAKLDDFKSIAADKATTMGHIQRRHLDEAVRVPAQRLVERHDALMTGLWNRALAAEQERLALEATRDALLPALMSGKLRVRDAIDLVEETAS